MVDRLSFYGLVSFGDSQWPKRVLDTLETTGLEMNSFVWYKAPASREGKQYGGHHIDYIFSQNPPLYMIMFLLCHIETNCQLRWGILQDRFHCTFFE